MKPLQRQSDHLTNLSSLNFQCGQIQDLFPTQIAFPSDRLYSKELSSFWSLQQSEVHPACVFFPEGSQHISEALKISRNTYCPFAVKSGGHVPFAGASNIADGITIDLSRMNEISINKNNGTVFIEPGNTWLDIYRRLADENLTVVGGRIGEVGIGGLTLGGGISFFSNIHGLACDNVASYEVIIANGNTVTASATENPDLYWALRGGGNNFGIVTKFELFSYPHDGSMWLGKIRHLGAQNASLIDAFADFSATSTDEKATMLFSVLYFQKLGQYLCVTEMDYSTPVPNQEVPSVFEPFVAVPDALQTTMGTRTVIEVLEEHSASNPNGLRQSYWTATFRLDKAMLQYIVDAWKEEVDPLKELITGMIPVITIQVVTQDMIKHMSDNGGNALGLEQETQPLIIALASAMWMNQVDDAAVYKAYTNWLSKTTQKAKEMDLDHDYLYMNYASQFQDPLRSYGANSIARLTEVAKKFDPDAVFQKLQPGHFKL